MGKAKIQPQKVLRLRLLAAADFRTKAETHFTSACRKWPGLKKMGDGDVVILRSFSGTQIRFVFGYRHVQNAKGEFVPVFRYENYEIKRGVWDEMMLQNYTHDAGYHLDGILTFEEKMSRFERVLSDAFKAATEDVIDLAKARAKRTPKNQPHQQRRAAAR